MESVVAVLGTVAGLLAGIGGTYLNQRLVFQRQSGERLGSIRRQAYVEFIASVHDMFLRIDAACRDLRDDVAIAEETRNALRQVSPRDAQVALEHLRLVATEGGAAAAGALWAHLRREHLPTGRRVELDGFESWRADYWQARRRVIDAARNEFGFSALDWEAVGVG